MTADDDPARARRRELGAFLRARREQTTPAEVGLPGSPRRRTPGLRREELAVLAGVSTTWYTYLEQGRNVRPSGQVLAAIAGALCLTAEERTHLHSLSDPTPELTRPAAAPTTAAREQVSPEVAAIPALLHPAPAYITGATTDVLAWNEAAAQLFSSLIDHAPGATPNLARWIFLDPKAKELLVDWSAVAQTVLARLRTNAGHHPEDPRFPALAHELRTASTEADAWWPRYDIATNRSGTKQIRHPTRGLLTLTHAALTVTDAPDQVLVVYSIP
ncbi:helix-turn-helix transcriptional regulator [Nocardia sp. NPDC020380]|uniref:helix-turn-helix transcriptional regulator n=1 Tax=Nocardia sp. NPDC020380 TaxID=3364309 RepID=UPI00379DC9C6